MRLIIKREILIVSILVLFISSVNAQERGVKGKVTAFKQIPINKASIVLKKSGREIFSDRNGSFSFTCDEKEKITFSANGFFSEKFNISDLPESDSLKIDLRFKKGKKNFEVATGYGHISEKNLTYAIEHLETDSDYSKYRNILEAIEGKVSGVTVSGNAINIRGTSTLNGGATSALLVVDGTIVEFPVFINIPTEQVKSISILKGGAASARYGSRGMGGVIVVKTKSEN